MTSPRSLRIGLNPYGLAYTLGLQGAGTPRVRPNARGLEEFVEIAHAIGAKCIEFDWRWLVPRPPAEVAWLGDNCRAADMTVLCSAWLVQQTNETLDDAIRVSAALQAACLRLHLTPVLEGARAALGPHWTTIVGHARATLAREAPKAAAAGLTLALENHQDFGSEELLALSTEAGDHVGIVFDTGNPFSVGEDPVAFAVRARPRIRHVHLKDYRAQFTDEGVRLVRCAVGDGCVPFADVAALLVPETAASPVPLTASIEMGALESRHIRLFTAPWWAGYPQRDARELGVALGRLRVNQLPDDVDVRTPWEGEDKPEAIVAYERAQLTRSVANLRAMGLGAA